MWNNGEATHDCQGAKTSDFYDINRGQVVSNFVVAPIKQLECISIRPYLQVFTKFCREGQLWSIDLLGMLALARKIRVIENLEPKLGCGTLRLAFPPLHLDVIEMPWNMKWQVKIAFLGLCTIQFFIYNLENTGTTLSFDSFMRVWLDWNPAKKPFLLIKKLIILSSTSGPKEYQSRLIEKMTLHAIF